MIELDTTNMCSHLQKKLFQPDGIYFPVWEAMKDDNEITVMIRSRQLHIYRNGTAFDDGQNAVLILAGKAKPKFICEDTLCDLLKFAEI